MDLLRGIVAGMLLLLLTLFCLMCVLLILGLNFTGIEASRSDEFVMGFVGLTFMVVLALAIGAERE